MAAAEGVGTLAHALEIALHRDEPADQRTHTGAADGIDRDAAFGERTRYTDVSKAARAAAGQHQAQSEPGEQARGAFDIGARANVELPARTQRVEPGRGPVWHD